MLYCRGLSMIPGKTMYSITSKKKRPKQLEVIFRVFDFVGCVDFPSPIQDFGCCMFNNLQPSHFKGQRILGEY